MESFVQSNESFRQGLLAGYVFAATFSIVFCMAYYVPTQLGKKCKHEKGARKEARQMRKLSHQELKQQRIKEKQRKATRQRDKLMSVEVLEKRTEINAVARSIFRMSFTNLCSATNYFSEKNAIRVGMTGIMYKAALPYGFLAVKRLYDSQLLTKQFELEIMILGRYNHRNIVPLLGFCIEEERKERILVYQYMSNGRLSDWFNDTTRLGWPVVVRIALGVARGLSFLHHSLHVAHVNISSDCILLGNNFEPKISSFRGAIFVNHDLDKNRGFEKDVYDFGTLLFELIRGKKFDQFGDYFGNAEGGPFSTYTYPTNLFEEPCGFYDAMDKRLDEREFDDEVSALMRVACDCVHPVPNQRPTIVEVYSEMSNIWERGRFFVTRRDQGRESWWWARITKIGFRALFAQFSLPRGKQGRERWGSDLLPQISYRHFPLLLLAGLAFIGPGEEVHA